MIVKRFGYLLIGATILILGACQNDTVSPKTKPQPTIKVRHIDTENRQKKNKLDKTKLALVQQQIEDYLRKNNLSGSISVIRGKQTIYNGGVGYADAEKKIFNQSSTSFPIGSITKTFVATSIMKLQEEKKLNINDPVSMYIPSFPNGAKIRLFNFLTHTSGIQRLHWQRGDTTPVSLVQEIERMPLKFQPGTQWDYLDANYMVLGYIVEKVSGMSLHEYIQKNIFDKAGMKETGFITREHPIPYTSVSYFDKDGNVEMTKYLNTYTLFGCGDIYSTANNMSLYDQALANGVLVSQQSLDQILTPSGKSKYGLGLYNDGEHFFSIGVLGGWYSMHAYYPDKTSIVVLLNARNKKMNIELIMTDLYNIVKKESPPQIQTVAKKLSN